MAGGGLSGVKFCPYCKKRLSTFVNTPEKTENVIVHNLEAKRREIRCSECNKTWNTLEVIEDQFNAELSKEGD